MLLTSSADGTVIQWNWRTGKRLDERREITSTSTSTASEAAANKGKSKGNKGSFISSSSSSFKDSKGSRRDSGALLTPSELSRLAKKGRYDGAEAGKFSHRITEPSAIRSVTLFAGGPGLLDPTGGHGTNALSSTSSSTFSAINNTRVVVGCVDGSVSLWNLNSHTKLSCIEPDLGWQTARGKATAAGWLDPQRHHTGPLYSVRVAPDGNTLATASTDGTVKLWNVISWRSTDAELTSRMHQYRLAKEKALERRLEAQGVLESSYGGHGDDSGDGAGDGPGARRHSLHLLSLYDVEDVSNNHSHGSHGEEDDADGGAGSEGASGDGSSSSSDDSRRRRPRRRPKEDVPIESTGIRSSLVQTLRHEGAVKFAEFTATSQFLITASLDSTMKVWSTETGDQVYQLNLPYPVSSMCVQRALTPPQTEDILQQHTAAATSASGSDASSSSSSSSSTSSPSAGGKRVSSKGQLFQLTRGIIIAPPPPSRSFVETAIAEIQGVFVARVFAAVGRRLLCVEFSVRRQEVPFAPEKEDDSTSEGQGDGDGDEDEVGDVLDEPGATMSPSKDGSKKKRDAGETIGAVLDDPSSAAVSAEVSPLGTSALIRKPIQVVSTSVHSLKWRKEARQHRLRQQQRRDIAATATGSSGHSSMLQGYLATDYLAMLINKTSGLDAASLNSNLARYELTPADVLRIIGQVTSTGYFDECTVLKALAAPGDMAKPLYRDILAGLPIEEALIQLGFVSYLTPSQLIAQVHASTTSSSSTMMMALGGSGAAAAATTGSDAANAGGSEADGALQQHHNQHQQQHQHESLPMLPPISLGRLHADAPRLPTVSHGNIPSTSLSHIRLSQAGGRGRAGSHVAQGNDFFYMHVPAPSSHASTSASTSAYSSSSSSSSLAAGSRASRRAVGGGVAAAHHNHIRYAPSQQIALMARLERGEHVPHALQEMIKPHIATEMAAITATHASTIATASAAAAAAAEAAAAESAMTQVRQEYQQRLQYQQQMQQFQQQQQQQQQGTHNQTNIGGPLSHVSDNGYVTVFPKQTDLPPWLSRQLQQSVTRRYSLSTAGSEGKSANGSSDASDSSGGPKQPEIAFGEIAYMSLAAPPSASSASSSASACSSSFLSSVDRGGDLAAGAGRLSDGSSLPPLVGVVPLSSGRQQQQHTQHQSQYQQQYQQHQHQQHGVPSASSALQYAKKLARVAAESVHQSIRQHPHSLGPSVYSSHDLFASPSSPSSPTASILPPPPAEASPRRMAPASRPYDLKELMSLASKGFDHAVPRKHKTQGQGQAQGQAQGSGSATNVDAGAVFGDLLQEASRADDTGSSAATTTTISNSDAGTSTQTPRSADDAGSVTSAQWGLPGSHATSRHGMPRPSRAITTSSFAPAQGRGIDNWRPKPGPLAILGTSGSSGGRDARRSVGDVGAGDHYAPSSPSSSSSSSSSVSVVASSQAQSSARATPRSSAPITSSTAVAPWGRQQQHQQQQRIPQVTSSKVAGLDLFWNDASASTSASSGASSGGRTSHYSDAIKRTVRGGAAGDSSGGSAKDSGIAFREFVMASPATANTATKAGSGARKAGGNAGGEAQEKEDATSTSSGSSKGVPGQQTSIQLPPDPKRLVEGDVVFLDSAIDV